MDIIQRLEIFKQSLGFTNSQFADKAGIPRPTLSQFLNGRNKRLSDDMIAKLHTAYPNLNVIWLLFGEGVMVLNGNIEISEGKIGQFSHLSDNKNAGNQLFKYENESPLESSKCETNEIKMNESASHGLSQPQNQSFKEATDIPHPVFAINSMKKIQSIMVFYSDNSYEMFVPSNSNCS